MKKISSILIGMILLALIFSRSPSTIINHDIITNIEARENLGASLKTSEWNPGFNYTIIDNYPYSWIEINETGTEFTSFYFDADDGCNHTSFADHGWNFTFYGTEYSYLNVSTNGWMTFCNLNDGWKYNLDSYDWQDIPQNCSDFSDPNNRNHNDTVCLLATDLDLDVNGQIFYQFFGTAPNRYLVIEYYEVDEFSTTDKQTMEAIFYENGDIKFQYKKITDPAGWNRPDAKVGLDHGDLIHYSNYTNDWNANFGDVVNELAVYFRLNKNYTMNTNADYNWHEIRQDGTHMAWLSNQDDGYENITFVGQGWNFTFFDTEYTKISVSSNGWMSFTNLGETWWFIYDIPDIIDENKDCVSLLCTDIDLSLGGDVYYYFGGSEPNRYLIIEYYRAYDYDTEELIGDFQVIFYESGNIKFQYKIINDIAMEFPIIGLDHGDLNPLHYNSYLPTLPLTTMAIEFIINASTEDLVDFTPSPLPPSGGGDDDDDDDEEEADLIVPIIVTAVIISAIGCLAVVVVLIKKGIIDISKLKAKLKR